MLKANVLTYIKSSSGQTSERENATRFLNIKVTRLDIKWFTTGEFRGPGETQ